MASFITAGNATNGLQVSSDNTGILELKSGTGAGTTALTIGTNQVVTGTAGNVMLISGTVNAGGTTPFPSSGGPATVDFTGIPSWVKRITVMFNGVSTSGTSSPLIYLGDSGGFETSGYAGSSSRIYTGASAVAALSTSGFLLVAGGLTAAATISGSATISLQNSATNAWTFSSVIGDTVPQTSFCGGSKSLSDVLTQIRITTAGGTDTFDAGSINILYE